MTEPGSLNPMPAPSIIIPDQGEAMFPVRLKEWARLKEKIVALKRHRRQWSGLGWALLGIGTSALLSWFPYLGSSPAAEWIPPVTLAVGVAGTVSGALALIFSSETQKSIEEAVKQIRVHMYDMESGLTADQKEQVAAFATIVLDD